MAARGLTTGAIALVVVVGVSLGAAETAAADGASPGILIGPPGVAIPGGQERIVTRVRTGGTVVTRETPDGRGLGHISLPGVVLGLPRITFRGRIEGPTRDGRAVVLASQYSSATTGSRTRFVVLDTHTLRVVRTIRLRGAFAFDALSPDGQTLYLLQYPASSSPLRYVVRALDLTAGRLYPRPIVDESEPDEQMAGLPVARTTGPGGRWVYTLYTSPDRNGHAFVHALDTLERAARCIDLPWRAAELGGIDRASLRIEDGTLVLRERGVGVLASIDLRTFRVLVVHRPVPPRR